MKFKILLSKHFRVPLICLLGIIFYLFLKSLKMELPADIVAIFITLLGSYGLLTETLKKILEKRFALDYIAILAIAVSFYSQEFLVAAVLALMIASGRTLESYGASQAKKSLTKLIERIPDEVLLWKNDKAVNKTKIKNITIGQEIFIRKGEVIPLDGTLLSPSGQTDESSVTGEPYFIEKIMGDVIRSGTLNIGNPMIIRVTKTEEDSTYKKIVDLVKKAESEQSPFVRLADRYSGYFAGGTLIIAAFAYFSSGFDLTRVLSVLAIATPCPLIIATPIALLGGVNSAAKKRIIIKRLSSLESLSRVDTVIFDKTGTITLGRPKLTEVALISDKFTRQKILSIAEAIERNSLHPLAKAVVAFARENKAATLHARDVQEIIGHGISGVLDNQKYVMSKIKGDVGMAIELTSKGKRLAIFKFEDEIKADSKNSFAFLQKMGLDLKIFTGDKTAAALDITKKLQLDIETRAQMSPEDKQSGIKNLQKAGKIVAMIGDGINDAPALALADVGLVFSNEEQTAASEAADIVFLGGDFSSVLSSLQISRRSIAIAKQSIFFGMGLSTIGMIIASLGYIPPIFGAGLQEVIDVAVILNALRASI